MSIKQTKSGGYAVTVTHSGVRYHVGICDTKAQAEVTQKNFRRYLQAGCN